MDASRLRPLRVGEVIDAAISVYRQRWQDLCRVVAVIVVPLAVLNAIVTLSASFSASANDSTTTFGNGGFTTTSNGEIDTTALWTFVAGFLVVAVIGWVGTQLAVAACFEIVSGTYLDREPTWRESLGKAWSRLGSLVWLQIVYGFLLVLGFVACLVPGIYFYVAWAVAVPVLLFEPVRGRKALKRSRELLKDRWWPTAAVLILVFLLNGVLSTAITGVLTAFVSSSDNDLVDALATAIARSGASILTTPFAAAVSTVLYYDALVRKEGFDLQQMAIGFGVDPSTAPPSPYVMDTPPFERDAPTQSAEPPFWPPPPGWRPPE
jgi:hypothetical protein